jgi:hypothetical protein
MRNLLRSAAVAATGALIATTFAAPAQAAPPDDAAAWLQSQQRDDGLVDNVTFGSPDYGLSADFGLAFASIGGQADALALVRQGLEDNAGSYVGTGGESYAGSVAKLLVLAQQSGGGGRDFGGINLVKRLNARVVKRGPSRGRIKDKSEFGDFANAIGQALAVRSLGRAGSSQTRAATRFLLLQQCRAGFFRLNLRPDPGKANQSCDAGRGNGKAPDTDATALAVLGLRALPSAYRTKATRGAIADATAWLLRRQKDNGSFGGGVATEASNSNSTGLAAWALGENGNCARARTAARWVRDLQVGDATGTPLEGEDGAVAYDRAALRTAEDAGITDGARDQWRRATAQAAPGLRFVQGC